MPEPTFPTVPPQLAHLSIEGVASTVQFFTCNECGCIFMPTDDGEAFFPDRFHTVTNQGTVDIHDCRCHHLPYEIREDT